MIKTIPNPKYIKKIFLLIFFIIFYGSYSYAFPFVGNKISDHISSDYIKNYLYGSLELNLKDYNSAFNSFNESKPYKNEHNYYNYKYVVSMINKKNVEGATLFINRLEKKYQENYLFKLIQVSHLIKKEKTKEAKEKIAQLGYIDEITYELNELLKFWIALIDTPKDKRTAEILKYRSRFKNIEIINKLLGFMYIQDEKNLSSITNQILNSQNLLRYQIFISWEMQKKGNIEEAKKILENSYDKNYSNILLRQSILSLKNGDKKISTFYHAEDLSNVISEIFYIFANLYQSNNDINFSQILLSISEYLNKNFVSNKLLEFENLSIDNKEFKYPANLITEIKSIGEEYNWYINFFLLTNSDQNNLSSLKTLITKSKEFKDEKYYSLANYYRIKKNYKDCISNFEKITANHFLKLPEFYYYKGICYERLNEWNNAETNFKKSLSLSAKQYALLNYYGYSLLEKKKDFEKAKKMILQALELSNWQHGYIIDSLAWAHYLNGNYEEAEKFIEQAYIKSPNEAEVYDHYGDILWKKNKVIQARHVWNNALSLQGIEEERKKNIQSKLIFGLSKND